MTTNYTRMTLMAALFGLCAMISGMVTMKCHAAPPPISYSRQILPLFKTQCMSCHSGATPASGYSMDTRDRLIAGGRHGAAITLGKGADSTLVKYMTGENKPKMPPNGAIDLDRIALVRRWIDEGAKIDSDKMPESGKTDIVRGKPGIGTMPHNFTPGTPAPVTALAYAPDGKLLAVGGYRVVRLLDPATGEVTKTVPGAADQVQALAWSSDGNTLAVAGGTPGMAGEVVLFDTHTWQPIRKLVGHTEVVYAVAWKPNSIELATGSLDKTACIWDGSTGKLLRTIKDHAEGVMGIAYSPDGKILATGSLDRSAKLFDTATWKRLSALTAHQDGVTRVAFNQNGTRIATAGLDRTVRIWTIKPGTIENPDRTLGEGDIINACTFSPDGNLLVWGASNSTVKVFNGDGTQQKREIKEAKDWIYSVAVSADNETITAGTQEGKVYFWTAKDGKLVRQVTMTPAPSAGK